MEQRPHVLYITHLIRKGHGYPFWFPEPDSSRSAAYTERGVHPGDVGILNDIGGFDYLFNIFCDADDPVNGGNVPPDFRPLRRQTSESPRIMPACYNYNITSADVNSTEISAGVSADVTGLARAEASFEFSTTRESAAILCLPHSATKHEILSKGAIKEYATANGPAWYTYVNSSQYLGREAPNGSLYVATGCDKTDSWGTAVVGKPSHSRSVCLSFIAAGMAGGELRAGHTWNAGFSVDTRVYPLPSARYPYPRDLENQCIFARGFTISLRSDGLFKSDGKTVLRNISGSLKDKIPSFDNRAPCPRLPGETESSGRRLYFPWISHGTPPVMDNEDDLGPNADRLSDTDFDCEMSISEFPPRDSELMNPSAAMNLYLLEKDPSLDIVVTHDEEWMKIIQEFETGGDTTDEILWAQIRDELDKRSLSPATDSISLSKINATAEQDSDNHFQLSPTISTGSTVSRPSPFFSSSSFPHTRVLPTAQNMLAQLGLSIAPAIRNLRAMGSYIVSTGNEDHSDSTPKSSGSSYEQHAFSETPDLSQMSTQNSYSPAPHPHISPQELRRCETVEKRLAQSFGMDSDSQHIDSEVVLKEARRRPTTRRPRRLGGARESVRQDNVEDLENLKLFGTRSNQPLPPAILYHASRFWAILIGIDAYQSNPLHGCVSDALMMKKLLTEKFEVPEDRIQCLLGSNDLTPGSSTIPSRANIINVFYNLIGNAEIQRGDNIIIYYAGYGSSYRCSQQCAPHSTCHKAGVCPIEAMCPIDRDTMDADSRCWIPDISDREINALFTQISRAKGHKITFLADCCHVGGMSRYPSLPTGTRAVAPTSHSDVNDMLRAAHTRLRHLPRYRSVLSQNWQADMSSHVTVAACQDYQTARESGGGGDRCGGEFTRSLVDALTSGECNQGTTYQDLADLLNRSVTQTPSVCGDHMNEPLWYLNTATGPPTMPTQVGTQSSDKSASLGFKVGTKFGQIP